MEDEPISLAAIRATKLEDGRLWGPKDVLKDVYKDINDSDATADAMVIVWRERLPDGNTRTRWAQCGPDVQTALGLCTIAQQRMYLSMKVD